MSNESRNDTRKEVLDFLKDINTHYGTYHNHKETLAWAAVALFVALIVGFAATLFRLPDQFEVSCDVRTLFTFVVLIIAGVFWFYLKKQFALRKQAGDYAAACLRLRSVILSNPSTALNLDDWGPPREEPTQQMQSRQVLPRAVIKEADNVSQSGQDFRVSLERCAYGILLVLVLAVLFAIWTAG